MHSEGVGEIVLSEDDQNVDIWVRPNRRRLVSLPRCLNFEMVIDMITVLFRVRRRAVINHHNLRAREHLLHEHRAQSARS